MSKCIKCGSEILTGDIHWEMGLCNNCYNELYKDHKTHISLDKMWLELAQSFRDENEKLQGKISDLETKLAEKQEVRDFYLKRYEKKLKKYDKENKQLKQQLAEKDEEYQSFKKISDENVNYLKNRILEETRNYNQDKIEFAIEQLEETRKLIANLDMPDSPVLYNNDMFQAGFDSHYVRTRQTIDNQINELKEKK